VRHWHGYRHRPAEARRLLEEAGCRRGSDGIYVCGGRRLSLRLAARGARGAGASTLERTVVPLLEEQLRAIGIEVVPVFHDARAFFETVLPSGNFDLALFAWVGIGGPEPGWAVEVFRCGGRSNFAGYCNRQVTRKLLQSQVIVDQQTRMRLLNRVDALLARDVPMIPLFQRPWFLALNPRLRGVVGNPWEGFTWNAEDWWLAG
jgi:peptide/nickel transport system substrate-binding protein